MTVRQIVVLVLLAASGIAMAQQPGTVEYNTVFLPAHGVGDTRAPAEGDSWGAFAIAMGNEDGVSMTGWAINHATETQARNASLEMCDRRGGKDCVVDLVFMNQCAAVTTSDAGTYASRDRTLKLSRRAAREHCGSGCRILYEGCTSQR